MPGMLTILTTASVLLLGFVYARAVKWQRRLPPGPTGLPLIGNIFNMPTTEHWKTFSDWSRKFGDVIYLSILGKPHIILTSSEAALDLFDRQSNLYSDRPQLIMAGELCGMARIAPLTRYGNPLREQRRIMQRVLSQTAVRSYEYIQAREIKGMISRMISDPVKFASHIRRMAGSTILEIIYGYRVLGGGDPLVAIAEEAMVASTHVGTNVWAVDFIPALRYLPHWMPGAGFLTIAENCRRVMESSVEIPFQLAKAAVMSGKFQPSLVSTLLHPENGSVVDEDEEENIKWTTNSLYVAGADTTSAVVTAFCLAMILRPEIQRKAQNEIDSVIGTERVPAIGDRENLPYVDCIVKECLRWNAPVPTTPPRELMEHNEYRSWIIPKGTICLANIWSILHGENIYPSPEVFSPERFELSSGEKVTKQHDPRTYAFGFGRRRCPGIHLAENTVWLSIATLLATVTIKISRDDEGRDILPEIKFTSGGIRHPSAFKCTFEPRRAWQYHDHDQTEGGLKVQSQNQNQNQ